MSLSGFSSSSVGKAPRRFCEGEPAYRRSETGTISSGNSYGDPGDRSFQTFPAKMAPSIAYRDGRDWQSTEHSYQQSGGYYSTTGHPNDVPGHHINEPYSHSGQPDNQYRQSDNQYGQPDNQYGQSDNQYGQPNNQYRHQNHEPVHCNSYSSSPVHSEMKNYTSFSNHSYNHHSSYQYQSGTSSSGYGDHIHENGYGEEERLPLKSQNSKSMRQNSQHEQSMRHSNSQHDICSYNEPPHHPQMDHNQLSSTTNGPPSQQDYWRHEKPHPHQQGHIHQGSRPIHEGGSSPYNQESNHRGREEELPLNYTRVDGSNQGYWDARGGGCSGGESDTSSSSNARERPVVAPSLSWTHGAGGSGAGGAGGGDVGTERTVAPSISWAHQGGGGGGGRGRGWEGASHSHHISRRSSEPSVRKSFAGTSTSEDRRHGHAMVDRPGPSYSPSLSSQSSWSPETGGSPRLRRHHQASPATPDDQTLSYDLHSESRHPHYHPHHPSQPLPPSPGFSKPPSNQSTFKRERPGFRITEEHGRYPGKSREEKRQFYSRVPQYQERRGGTMNGASLGVSQLVRDPRQSNRAQRDAKAILQEHSYSKKYYDGCKDCPRFKRVPPCSDLSPEFLTALKSTKGKKKNDFETGSSPVGQDKNVCAGTEDTKLDRKSPSNINSTHSTITQLLQKERDANHNIRKTDSSSGVSSILKSGSEQRNNPRAPPISPQLTDPAEKILKLKYPVQPSAKSASTPLVTCIALVGKIKSEPRSPPLPPASSHSPSLPAANGKESLFTSGNPVKVENVEKVHTNKGLGIKEEHGMKSPRSVSSDDIISLDGFHLDLDLEPTSGSCSNSTCCSETEDQAESRAGDSDMDTEVEGRGGRERRSVTGSDQSSDDESLVISLTDSPRVSEFEDENPETWSIVSPEPGKMKFSRLDNLEKSPEMERVSVKQMTSNRIQLRNGRVLPASSLAYLAKVTSPQSDVAKSLSSSPGSPRDSEPTHGAGHLRRSKRIAVQGDSIPFNLLAPYTDSDSTTEQCSTADQSFDTTTTLSDASSDESDFDMPDFNPRANTPPHVAGESLGKGKRGRGRGRSLRRGSRRGTGRASYKNVERQELPVVLSNGVKFYNHKPRTREEGTILQRRLALEMEVKRNERIQSEHNLSDTHSHTDINHKDDDGGSTMSGPTSTSSLSLDVSSHASSSSSSSQKTSNLLVDFSPDLVARVKKISTARSSGDTPLHKCCRTGKYDMVRYLLVAENAAVNVQDNAGWTPLHEATSNHHIDIAELLLQHGADSNASARDGTRPIHDAIEIGHMELVKLLIEYKADLMVEYGERTPVEFAREHKQYEIADYIKGVIETREKKKKENLAASAAATTPTVSAHHQPKTTPTRSSKKDKILRQIENHGLRLPVSGYGPDCFSFGEELDFPLFYISPVIELSSKPFLSVYNFQISAPGTPNPRRHNFYLMDDILDSLGITESEFTSRCNEVNLLGLTVAEFQHRVKVSPYNSQVSVPEQFKAMSPTAVIKFVPLCAKLSRMLGIETENIDD